VVIFRLIDSLPNNPTKESLFGKVVKMQSRLRATFIISRSESNPTDYRIEADDYDFPTVFLWFSTRALNKRVSIPV
jgi:hypothetical protein